METKEYKLTDVCDFQGGTQPPKEEWITEPRDGYVRMLQIRDFTQDKAEHVGYVKDTKKLNKCEEDDILIGRYGASVGKILTGLAGAYNVAIIKTIPNEELLSKRYLYYVLTGTDFQNFILNIGARAAQAGFNKTDLSLFKLHIPTSLKDQERIADVLEKAKNLIKKREYSIDLLEGFLEMKFLETFGDPTSNPNKWPTLILKKLTTKIGSGSTPRGGKDSYINEGISLIRSLNVHDLKFLYKDLAHITDDQAKLLKNVIIQKKDVLLNITGASVCRCTIVPEEVLPARVNQHVSIIRPKTDKLTSEYLAYAIVSNNYKNYLLKLADVAGATREALTKEQIENLEIPVPDIELQRNFSDLVSKAQILRMQLVDSGHILKSLYDSLSHKALKGELEIIEKIYLEATIKIQPKISGEVIVIDKINKELEEFHKSRLHSGAPDEIDNKIRQLEAELKMRGEIPFWDEYVKYRIVKGKFKEAFTFDQLWEEITKFPFETVPEYDEVATMLFNWLAEENAFIRQQFNESTKQIELVLNETAKA